MNKYNNLFNDMSSNHANSFSHILYSDLIFTLILHINLHVLIMKAIILDSDL